MPRWAASPREEGSRTPGRRAPERIASRSIRSTPSRSVSPLRRSRRNHLASSSRMLLALYHRPVLGKNWTTSLQSGHSPPIPKEAHMAGTHDDAVLVVELAKLAAMSGVSEAARAIFADDFDPDSAEANDPHVRTVLGFNERV